VIKRLRPKHSQEFLSELYAEPHDHWRYGRGHGLRVSITQIIAKDIAREVQAETVADLSCGNGEIAKCLGIKKFLGDYAPGYEYTGPIEETLEQIPNVSLFICSETLEHLDDPWSVLHVIRKKSDGLVLTTPINAWEDTNKEHYWAWDKESIENMLTTTGWSSNVYAELDSTVFGETYTYGIWGCK
jgi:hypothetical protein